MLDLFGASSSGKRPAYDFDGSSGQSAAHPGSAFGAGQRSPLGVPPPAGVQNDAAPETVKSTIETLDYLKGPVARLPRVASGLNPAKRRLSLAATPRPNGATPLRLASARETA